MMKVLVYYIFKHILEITNYRYFNFQKVMNIGLVRKIDISTHINKIISS